MIYSVLDEENALKCQRLNYNDISVLEIYRIEINGMPMLELLSENIW